MPDALRTLRVPIFHGGQMKYEAPTVTELGSLRELTLAQNKVGLNTDMYTAVTGGNLVGSLVPAH
jgi:hypothetical protein